MQLAAMLNSSAESAYVSRWHCDQPVSAASGTLVCGPTGAYDVPSVGEDDGVTLAVGVGEGVGSADDTANRSDSQHTPYTLVHTLSFSPFGYVSTQSSPPPASSGCQGSHVACPAETLAAKLAEVGPMPAFPYSDFSRAVDARITGADDRSGQTEYLENFILEARVDARSHLVGSIDFSDRNRIIHGCETWKFDMMTPVF